MLEVFLVFNFFTFLCAPDVLLFFIFYFLASVPTQIYTFGNAGFRWYGKGECTVQALAIRHPAEWPGMDVEGKTKNKKECITIIYLSPIVDVVDVVDVVVIIFLPQSQKNILLCVDAVKSKFPKLWCATPTK